MRSRTKPEGAPKPAPGSPATVLRRAAAGRPARCRTDMTLDRLNNRRSLLGQFDDQQRLLESSRAVESATTGTSSRPTTSSPRRSSSRPSTLGAKTRSCVERYGGHLFGNSTLMARRLVERGVRFVNVTWDLFWDRVQVDYDAWDTHTSNFPILKDNKLPGLDQTFSALLEDLQCPRPARRNAGRA